ncbi:MAG: hypothetical protein JW844_00515 [Candidatus Omnitrophica bacterium]|nr:hypothetical protein [Candidatus Omnitrophota bacterium]
MHHPLPLNAQVVYLSLLLMLTAGAYPPVNGAIRWESIGPGGGGWIECLAVDPRDPGTVYAGSDVGGIFKSTDGGASWHASNIGLKNDFIRDIVIDPDNPDVIYAATPGGVHKSVDRGETWTVLRNGFPPVAAHAFSSPVNTIAIDPRNSSVLYAGVGRRDKEGAGTIYKSTDGGGHWWIVNADGTIHPRAVIYSICVHPVDTGVLYAGTDRGVYRSSDGGVTWSPKNNGLAHQNVRAVAVGARQPHTLYLALGALHREGTISGGAVYRSDNEGEDWELIREERLYSEGDISGDAPIGALSPDYFSIEVSPVDSRVCFAGDVSWKTGGLYVSRDAGTTWSGLTAPGHIRGYGWITQWGVGVTSAAIAPSDPRVMYIGTSGHIFRSGDEGRTWRQVYSAPAGGGDEGRSASRGLETTCIHSITLDPRIPGTLYVGYFDLGLLISRDGGRSFTRSVTGMSYPNNTFTVAPDPDDSLILYAGTGEWSRNEGALCKSTDGGASWRVIGTPKTGLPLGRPRFICVDPQSPRETRIVYTAIDEKGIFKSIDGGASWRAVNRGLSSQDIRALIVHPSRSDTLFTACGGTVEEGGGLYVTHNGAALWKRVATDEVFPNIQTLLIDPHNPEILYAGHRTYYDPARQEYISGGVFRGTDEARNWVKLLDDTFVSSIAVHPADPNSIYAGCPDHNYHDFSRGTGLYKSTDGGTHWALVNEGLSGLRVSCVSIQPEEPSVVYCGTEGNGLFRSSTQNSIHEEER